MIVQAAAFAVTFNADLITRVVNDPNATYYDPNADVREDQRERYSAVWEYVPFQFTQFRAGVRKNNGIPQNNAQNATELFAQWHAFF